MRCVGSACVLLILLCFPLAAHAGDSAATEAERHWTSGMAHYQLEEWDEAIREWEAGFRIKPAPQFLFNLAQAYRLSKHYDKALSFYRKYLYMEPHADNRAEVERQIHAMEPLAAAQPHEQPTPAPPVVTPAPVAAPIAAPPQPAPPAAVSVPATNELTKAPPPPKHKTWIWGVVAGAAVVVAAAVVVGVVVGTADSAKTLPMVRF